MVELEIKKENQNIENYNNIASIEVHEAYSSNTITFIKNEGCIKTMEMESLLKTIGEAFNFALTKKGKEGFSCFFWTKKTQKEEKKMANIRLSGNKGEQYVYNDIKVLEIPTSTSQKEKFLSTKDYLSVDSIDTLLNSIKELTGKTIEKKWNEANSLWEFNIKKEDEILEEK